MWARGGGLWITGAYEVQPAQGSTVHVLHVLAVAALTSGLRTWTQNQSTALPCVLRGDSARLCGAKKPVTRCWV
jgi:hypothetical protein